jgi:uncharacterized surface protein with fasciclin (FAS1) repeats
MRNIFNILLISGALLLFGCEDKWEEHYDVVPETIAMNVFEALKSNPDLSSFVALLEEYKYDTLFASMGTYSLFAPTNSALEGYTGDNNSTAKMLNYLLSPYFMNLGSINGQRKVQTLGEKYALFEVNGMAISFDGIPIAFESPLYSNGKYFILKELALPRPNIYEYVVQNLPMLRDYIDAQDSIILDKEKSRPIGYDEDGNTVYDSVIVKINLFEEEYFPVSKELRHKTATLVFPSQTDYNNALTKLAQDLGGGYIDFSDIPLEWQQDILIPYLLEYGMFENMKEPEQFVSGIIDDDTLKVKNILGDSIAIDYTPVNKILCSNGYVYQYDQFTMPDTLVFGATRFEGEALLATKGNQNFAWKEDVSVTTDIALKPIIELIANASNDSVFKVNFTDGYNGAFSVEFEVRNLFPRKYLMRVRTAIYTGGIFDIYVNDELVRTVDYYDQFQKPGAPPFTSMSVTGKRYVAEKGAIFNFFDCWVDNQAPYGQAKIRFEYKGPGVKTVFHGAKIANGLVMDYLDFVPQAN